MINCVESRIGSFLIILSVKTTFSLCKVVSIIFDIVIFSIIVLIVAFIRIVRIIFIICTIKFTNILKSSF